MRKGIVAGLTVLVIAVIAWAGNDPWRSKPFTEWTDQDIQKVFTDSPWARKVTIEGTWKPVMGVDAAGGEISAAGNGGGGGSKGIGGGSTVLPAEADLASGTRGPNVQFDVYWMSSETMRAALARRAMLHSGKTQEEVQKYVDTPADTYQIVVQGADLAPFYHDDEKFFAANSSLEIKKTKQKIQPTHVIYNRDPQNKITSAVFEFPKKANGQDTIPPTEKNVEFSVKLGKSTLYAEFDPSKMVNQKGPDL